MICPICQREFEPKPSNMKQQKYCSNECRAIVRKEHERQLNEKQKEKVRNRDRTKTCPVCQNQFWAEKNEKYCSDDCRHKANRMRKYTTDLAPKTGRRKIKEIKTLDDLMEIFKAEGKTPYDYREWKLEQAKKHVTPIII
jgi:predicted nucleic acid-binding Zn ribbon protein